MAYEGGQDYERLGRVALYLAFAGMIIAGVHTAFGPRTPDPVNGKAFGCYTNAKAAPILLDAQGMAILQRDPIRIDYRLERGKTGITMLASPAISADPVGDRYLFSTGTPGSGWFLDFINEQNGRSYGEFDENKLQQFEMLARDGTDLAYRKASAADCSSQAKS